MIIRIAKTVIVVMKKPLKYALRMLGAKYEHPNQARELR